jgi:DNA ligase-1
MWDGSEFWTRHGNMVKAPKWFKRGLPRVRIDGGIYADRKGFQIASNATRFGGKWFDEPGLEFVAFDFPEVSGRWDKRIRTAGRALKKSATAARLIFSKSRQIARATGS